MYFWLGLCLSLAGLLLLNAAASLTASAVWLWLEPRAMNWRAQDRARAVFAFRIAPVIGATLFVGVFLLPAYLTHEPAHTAENVGWPMSILALMTFAGFSLALWRGLTAWRATRRLVQSWLRAASPISLAGVNLPAFVVRHPFPVLAVVGVIRPRLFVAEQILTALTQRELTAALRHELGHLVTHDNLKRILLRACSDVLTIVPFGRSLDRDWAESAECAADEHAAQAGLETSLDLASALLKITRLATPESRANLPLGAYLLHPAEDRNMLARRVRQLAQGARQRVSYRLDLAVWAGLVSFLLLLALAASQTSATAILHQVLERIVAI